MSQEIADRGPRARKIVQLFDWMFSERADLDASYSSSI